jgi:hypothetical protein
LLLCLLALRAIPLVLLMQLASFFCLMLGSRPKLLAILFLLKYPRKDLNLQPIG